MSTITLNDSGDNNGKLNPVKGLQENLARDLGAQTFAAATVNGATIARAGQGDDPDAWRHDPGDAEHSEKGNGTGQGSENAGSQQKSPKADRKKKKDGDATTQVEKIFGLVGDIEFFHNPEMIAYARVTEGNMVVVAPVDSRDFALVLRRRYYSQYSSGPNDDSMKAAIRTLEARGNFEGRQCDVQLRTAFARECIYLNLARQDGSIVEVSTSGWRIVKDAPVRFWRSPGMRPLPLPVRNGSIAALAKIVHVASKHDFVLAVSWLLGALSDGPYPIAAFTGEHGTSKSTSTRLLRKLIDPNKALLRSVPREERDLAVTAKNSHILTFDNLSSIPAWFSDALCKLSVGGGFSYRQNYSDDAEIIFSERRPIVMNGIEDFATRGDLVDRCIFLRLAPISEKERKTEAELDSAFEREAPGILGALLDAVSHGLRKPAKLETRPRMADFAEWVASCEGRFEGTQIPIDGAGSWLLGDFMTAYRANRKEAIETVLDADSVAVALISFMDSRKSWTGNATGLLEELSKLTNEDVRRDKAWPRNARALSARLRRLAPALRASGISIKKDRDSDDRLLTVSKLNLEEPSNG